MHSSLFLSAFAGAALLGATSAQNIIVTNANVSYTMFAPTATQADSPSANFTANAAGDSDILFEHGWYYRVAGDANESAFKLGSLTVVNAGSHSDADWADLDARGLLAASLDVDAISTGATSGVVVQRMTVRNISANSLTVNLFNFVDYDVCTTANTANGSPDRHGVSATTCAEVAEFYGAGIDNWAVGAFSGTELGLADGVAGDLANGTLPFTGDYTGAFQWKDRVLSPGQSLTVMAVLGHNERACPASVDLYGSASPGTGGRLAQISSSARPVLGNTVSSDMSRALPGAVAVLNVGAAPLNLTVLGVTFLVDPAFAASIPATVDGSGNATTPISLPAAAALCNVPVFHQYLYIDAGAPNGLAASTGGMRWTLGNL